MELGKKSLLRAEVLCDMGTLLGGRKILEGVIFVELRIGTDQNVHHFNSLSN